MQDPFVLDHADQARDALRAFDSPTRRKGEDYYNRGTVGEWTIETPARAFATKVTGTQPYAVRLHLDDAGRWRGECACPVGADCKHLYAALKSLLAEHSSALTRSLSAGTVRQAPAGELRTATPPPVFAEEVARALGRRLEAEEKLFLQQLHRLYERVRLTREITERDLYQLNLPIGNTYAWRALSLWPVLPPTEREFWNYIALHLHEQHVEAPACLACVTDLASVRERVHRWQRHEEITRWRHTLGNLLTWGPVRDDLPAGEADVRVCVARESAWFEWRPPGEEKFYRVREKTAERLEEDLSRGRLLFAPEASSLLEAMRGRRTYGYQLEFSYRPAHADDITLAMLLRQPSLASRIVNVDGTPLRRSPEPLHWELQPPASAEGDYVLQLVQADGTAPPEILAVFDGAPTLFLTLASVFTGPPVPKQALDVSRPTVIPAPALESQAGLQWLQNLRVALPPALVERVVNVPLEVVLQASLQQRQFAGRSEQCCLRAIARSADGALEEQLRGEAWLPLDLDDGLVARKPAARAEENRIVLYDRSAQAPLPALLDELGAKWDGLADGHFVRVTKKFPDEFVAWLKRLPPKVEVRLEGELASLTHAEVAGTVRLEVTEAAIDWFDLRVVVDVSDTTLTAAEIKLLLNAKGGFVRLEGKGWRRLSFQLTAEDDAQLAHLGLAPGELDAEPQRLHALQLADEAAGRFLPAEQVAVLQRRATEIKTRVAPPVPASIRAELRPYQLEGFHFLAYLSTNHFGGILADDMGLGKTLQTLTWITWLRETSAASIGVKGRVPPCLVVCPKSVMDNWQAEVTRFAPGVRVRVWGPVSARSFQAGLDSADLHVINYALLRNAGTMLAKIQWLAVILDEGQYIKNPASLTAQVARSLRAGHRLVLTGTPIENRLMDLWSLMAFAMPGALGNRAQFSRLYDSKEDPFARRRLASRVRPFLLRRTKAQVARDLPDRIEEDLFCEMEGAQQMLYRAELKRAQQALLRVTTQKQLNEERFNILTSLLRLRQICCDPRLVKDDFKAESAKIEALLEQLEPLMEEGHKVLVFSQFVELLAKLRPELERRGWPVFYLTGETEDRGQLVQSFQRHEGAGLFLISLRAGGFGLNLTAASYVVLFDPWWNPAVENQAIDRTHRIGQNNKVIAYRLLIKDSIEEKIRSLQKSKSALADDVLGEEKFSQALTLEDLRFLLGD